MVSESMQLSFLYGLRRRHFFLVPYYLEGSREAAATQIQPQRERQPSEANSWQLQDHSVFGWQLQGQTPRPEPTPPQQHNLQPVFHSCFIFHRAGSIAIVIIHQGVLRLIRPGPKQERHALTSELCCEEWMNEWCKTIITSKNLILSYDSTFWGVFSRIQDNIKI